MGWLLYQAATALLLIVAAPYFLVRRSRHYLATLGGRVGRYASVESLPRLWIHAVSVGEVGVAKTLLGQIPDRVPVVLTTVTATGQEVARRTLGSRAEIAVLPFDLGRPIRRFWSRYTPAALILVEGDYWPLVLREAERRGVPVAVVNGRVSDRGLRRQRPFRRFLHHLYDPIRAFGVQTSTDRERLVSLGADPARIEVTGNLKFDSPEPDPLPELESAVLSLAAGRPVLVAGSTMAGEEGAVLDAFRRVGADRALLVLAPRHPERSDEVETEVRQAGLSLVRRSRLADGAPTAPAVCLLDTLGELAALYRIARGAFVGGTLVPTGGHNPLEPARWAVAVAAGPSMHNFAEIEALLDRRQAWHRVADAADLASVWRDWIDDPEAAAHLGRRAAAALEENRGATARSVALIAPLLEAVAAGGQQDKAGVG